MSLPGNAQPEHLARSLCQPAVMDNRPAAGCAMAAAMVARTDRNGHGQVDGPEIAGFEMGAGDDSPTTFAVTGRADPKRRARVIGGFDIRMD